MRLAATLTRAELSEILIEARAPVPSDEVELRVLRQINRSLPSRLRSVRESSRAPQKTHEERLREAHLELLPTLIENLRRKNRERGYQINEDAEAIAIYERLFTDAKKYQSYSLRNRRKSAVWHYWAKDLAGVYFRDVDRDAGWTKNGPACRFVSLVLERFLKRTVTNGAVEAGVLMCIRGSPPCPHLLDEFCGWPMYGVPAFDCPFHSPLIVRSGTGFWELAGVEDLKGALMTTYAMERLRAESPEAYQRVVECLRQRVTELDGERRSRLKVGNHI